MRGICGLFVLLAGSALLTAAEPAKKDAPLNRLAKESSPYLLQHANNPVDWFPWGPEAFEKARKEKKLVFLSIGYSACHWCHVMEKESFSNAAVAKILNEHFVCIKVDREERPDIDDLYMTALNLMGSRGGWPLSMFMMPDGKPIIGGTYWPREDREVDGNKVNGFLSVLGIMIDLKAKKPDDLQKQADSFAEATSESMMRASRGAALVPIERELVRAGVVGMREDLDPKYGGMGSAARKFVGTKFPMPPTLKFLLAEAAGSKDKELNALLTLTLEKMAEGGIYDHVDGGFHRYSTERTWTVPHFEKMLYDNAQLVELYSLAYRLDPKPLYSKVVRDTLGFVRQELTAPGGAFYSALDADSDGKEGAYYVWTSAELDAALENKSDIFVFKAAYGGSFNPNFEENTYILKPQRDFAEIAKEQKITGAELDAKLIALRSRLKRVRDKRNKPLLDTKILTSWNGQMIAGYAVAGTTFKEPKYVESAARAADFLLAHAKDKDGRLMRSTVGGERPEAKIAATLEDYTYFVYGLLQLHAATAEPRWLREAVRLSDEMVKYFSDEREGGFYFTAGDREKLFARGKNHTDGVQPSPNAQAANNFVLLAAATEDAKYRALAEKTAYQFARVMKANPSAVPGLLSVVSTLLDSAAKEVPKKIELPSGGLGLSKSDTVVKSAIEVGAVADGRLPVRVTLTIDRAYHLYANPVGNRMLIPSTTVLSFSRGGKPVEAAIVYPKGDLEEDQFTGDYRIYKGTLVLTALVDAADAKGLEAAIRVSACNDKGCLQPATIRLAADAK